MQHSKPNPLSQAPSQSATARATEILLSVWPLEKWCDVPIVVGVSGGGDSVALTVLLGKILVNRAPQITLAHFDHRLRPDSATAEKEAVAQLARRFGMAFASGAAATVPSASISENLLREQRFAFFETVLRKHGARYLVLAHTFDDQVETTLQRIFRGTGLRGLGGIQSFRSLGDDWVIVRPLLGCSRSLLREVLAEHKTEFHEDISNVDTRWTRNWVRHSLLPEIDSRFNGAPAAIVRLAEQAREANEALQVWAARLFDQTVNFQGSVVQINHQALSGTPDIVIRELLYAIWRKQGWPLRAVTSEHWRQISRSIVAGRPPHRFDLPGAIHVQRTNDVTTLSQ